MTDRVDLIELLRKIGIRASREAVEALLVHAYPLHGARTGQAPDRASPWRL